MKKKFKGFTLLELIIVMALTTILMTMIMQFIKPISDLFNNISAENLNRTVSDGINDYIVGSLRYAKSVQIYMNVDKLPNNVKPAGGSNTPIEKYSLEMAGLGNTTADKEKIQVIAIINDDSYGNKGYDEWANNRKYTGRIIRFKKGINVGFAPPHCYVAMGKAYYGKQSYYIVPSITEGGVTQATDEQNLRLTTYTIENQRDATGADIIDDPTDNEVLLTTTGGGKFVNYGTSGAAKFVVYDGKTSAAGTLGCNDGVNTFIVFTLPD